MLGKLARFLRMMGQDVIYLTQLGDNELLILTKIKDSILLTRDLELYKRAISQGLNSFYVEGNRVPAQLSEVTKRYGVPLDIDMDKSYCPLCNIKLAIATKEQVKNKLEPNTYLYCEQFWQCPNCEQIYWQGSHWKQIRKTLKQAQQNFVKTENETGVKKAI